MACKFGFSWKAPEFGTFYLKGSLFGYFSGNFSGFPRKLYYFLFLSPWRGYVFYLVRIVGIIFPGNYYSFPGWFFSTGAGNNFFLCFPVIFGLFRNKCLCFFVNKIRYYCLCQELLLPVAAFSKRFLFPEYVDVSDIPGLKFFHFLLLDLFHSSVHSFFSRRFRVL